MVKNIYRSDNKFKSAGLKYGSYSQRISRTKRKWSETVDNYDYPELVEITPGITKGQSKPLCH